MNFFMDVSAAFGGIKFFRSTAEKDLSREKQSPLKKFVYWGGEVNRKALINNSSRIFIEVRFREG